MYRIVTKEALKPTVILYEIEAPLVARKAQPGQFIILRVDENGERIPITIHDYDREKGTVTIIVQTIGATTEKLSHKQQGDCLHDFVGPLGKPTEVEGMKRVCVVGGGVGCAIALPIVAQNMITVGVNVMDNVMRYGNKFQQDKREQQNSLFGDLSSGMGVEIQKPELPQVPRMSAIEKLNIEKSLIGIFLSAHPLDEYEFEVTAMANITTAELTRFDGWRTPESRKASPAGEDTEAEEQSVDPTAWIGEKQNQPLLLAGIITSAEEAVSQKGNPYGRYVVEDYTGSYKLTLFGPAYQQFAPMMKPSLYVMLTGTIQQKGAGRQWFKEKPVAEAEYEFIVQKIDLLKDVQDKSMESLTLQVPIEMVQPDFINELTEQCQKHPGKASLKIQVYDELRKNLICFTSQTHLVHVDHDFYHWLKQQEMGSGMQHKIN